MHNLLQETKEEKHEKLKKGSKNIGELLPFGSGQSERLSVSAMRQKLDNMKGCDWFQEISVTIRKSKKTHVPKDR